MLCTSKEPVTAARAGGCAVGALDAINMESAQAIFGAAHETRSPFILQITQTTLAYTEPEELFALVMAPANQAKLPLAIHLHHGRSFEVCIRFLRFGVAKINLDTQIRVGFCDAVTEQVHQIEKEFAAADASGGVRKHDVRRLLSPARAAMQQAVANRMTAFGSAGRA